MTVNERFFQLDFEDWDAAKNHATARVWSIAQQS
jgi:hypothetical protein